eukprot:Plantae.Rhodophyta-Hildenbrandia_rubra.ctg174.p1 GENE.Plantae.Rhodophyta-Hildenbrandia_rubra.ctg174~~Plantae.Rhodophyta-Hildenbrandia_rubra.ctg174.p1  ORF type:complete len:173 (+),score=33.73 Plantae.Rhodophyta-Hildenbrandia_rubra.ctg174:340-858(+)
MSAFIPTLPLICPGSHSLQRLSKRATRRPYLLRKPPRATAVQPSPPTATSQPKKISDHWQDFAQTTLTKPEVEPTTSAWNELLERCAKEVTENPEDMQQMIWIMDMMKKTGIKRDAKTYEIMMKVCISRKDNASAFYLVEQMWDDKVLLGDVDLPDGMEKTLRAILPPDAFD